MSGMTATAGIPWDAIQWGNAPSWAAFVTAAIAAVLAMAAFRREQRRDQVAQQIRLQEQANKVAAWRANWKRAGLIENGVRVRNASDLPVDAVLVVIGSPEGQGQFVRIIDVIPPGETIDVPFGRDDKPYGRVRIGFTDAQGVTWVRMNGKLTVDDDKTQPSWYRAFALQQNAIVDAVNLLASWIVDVLSLLVRFITFVFFRRR